MIVIPVSILALAAGVALLIKVKTAGLGGLYRALSWLVILLSLLYMLCIVARGVMRHRHMAQMRTDREARFKEFQNFRMQRDSLRMKGDTIGLAKIDSTMKATMQTHMMGGSGHMGRGPGGEQWQHHHHGKGHHHGGGMYGGKGGGWNHPDGHGNGFHYGKGNYMSKDSSSTTNAGATKQ